MNKEDSPGADFKAEPGRDHLCTSPQSLPLLCYDRSNPAFVLLGVAA